jgi:hypothetical protein
MANGGSERRFSEAEMRAIMARAAKRSERARAAEAERAGGFSIEELEQIAAAAGIDPAHVVAAVGEVEGGAGTADRYLGAPVVVERVRRLAGPVSDEAWARIVNEARRAFHEDGMAGQVGRIREWSALGRGHRRDLTTRLALEPDGDGTRVTLRQSTRDFAFAFSIAGGITGVMAVLFTALAAAGVDSELWIPAAMMTAMALLFLGGLQVGLRVWARRQEAKFEGLLDRVELLAREDVAEARGTAAPVREVARHDPAAGRLALDAAEDPVEEAPAAERRRSRT